MSCNSYIRSLTFVCSGALALVTTGAMGAVDFARDIQPILAEYCYDCHGADEVEGGLRLTSREHALKGGLAGEPAFIPGDSEESLLIYMITSEDPDEVMPQKRERLTPAQVQLLKQWIDEGAKWPKDLKHWAYMKPVRPTVPAVHKSRARIYNPIDNFIFARLGQEGLAPSPEVDRARWLRRVSLDLVGLPPTPAEVDAFLADRGEQAFERVVDRLLASPHYGERWARPWLDLARYADSHGFQRDDLRDLWPYRDWVIRAINADLPFDRFTISQIAGDLLPEAQAENGAGRDLDPLIATGFHRSAPTNVEAGTDQEEGRVNQVFDRVNTTAAVWLGSTLECAQCHNHKYDPITQKDYYQLFAFFNQTEQETAFLTPKAKASLKFTGPYIELRDPENETARAAAQARLAEAKEKHDPLRKQLLAEFDAWQQAIAETIGNINAASANVDLPKGIAEILRIPVEDRSASQKKKLQSQYLELDKTYRKAKTELDSAQEEVDRLAPPRTLVMRESATPRPTAVFNRGSFLAPGEPVEPGTPAVLHPLGDYSEASGSGQRTRLDLARWLVDPENPLVARVTVNRWWAEFFGRGIVATPEDFGVKGDRPTHPKLLDWLAVEFMERGWSRKHIHKLIVLSATYRQSSRVTPELFAIDDQNKLYARGPRFRLDAETIRDNALAAAGLLSRKLGGPPVRPYQPPGLWENKVGGERVKYEMSEGEDAWRRGIYTVWKRSAPYPSFMNFDATARTACTIKRSRSNTPLQALTLLNDPVYVEAAMALARRALLERPVAPADERIRHAFRLCLVRAPRDSEVTALAELYTQQAAVYAANPAAAKELVGDFAVPAGVDLTEFAAWHAVATALLNLDEMITKG